MNLPNTLTISRIFLVPLLVVVLLTKFEGHAILGIQKELVAAGIFLRSLRDAQTIDTGFETSGVLVMTFNLGREGYTPDRGQVFFEGPPRRLRRGRPRLHVAEEIHLLGELLHLAPQRLDRLVAVLRRFQRRFQV